MLFLPPISQVSVSQDNDVRVERLKEQYREIFKPELGTVKGVKAKLYLKENAKPVFQRARPVQCVAQFPAGTSVRPKKSKLGYFRWDFNCSSTEAIRRKNEHLRYQVMVLAGFWV